MEELLLRAEAREPPPLSRIVRGTSWGVELGTRPLFNASRGGDFTISQFRATPAEIRAGPAPLGVSTEKTPCSIFSGVLPRLSSGFIGTIPSLPFWRTKTAVEVLKIG